MGEPVLISTDQEAEIQGGPWKGPPPSNPTSISYIIPFHVSTDSPNGTSSSGTRVQTLGLRETLKTLTIIGVELRYQLEGGGSAPTTLY